MSLIKLVINSNKSLWRTPLPFNKYVGNARSFSSSANENKVNETEPTDWLSIFKFPYVELVAAANKLKIYQAVFASAAVPASFLAPPEILNPFVVAYIGCTGFLVLTAASYAFKDTVGFIYTSEQRPDLVKFSTVTFWGKREDSVMKIEDVMAFSEMPKNRIETYVTFLQSFNGHKKLKLVYKFGGIYNLNEFIKVFGEER
jgi:hypothetical protein